ncbi:MAG: mobile mystery protein A [Bdellovibrionota bacterium]
MDKETLAVRRRTLSKGLALLRSYMVRSPKKGWVAEIRSLLGMRADHLAKRIGVSQQAVSQLEQYERNGGVTLDSLRKAADALNCELYYAFIPRENLEEQMINRAKAVVLKEFNRVKTTMALEDQLSKEGISDTKLMLEATKLVANLDRRIWDEE